MRGLPFLLDVVDFADLLLPIRRPWTGWRFSGDIMTIRPLHEVLKADAEKE
jgi:hypothetical protein